MLLGAIIVIGALRKPNSPLGAVSWRGIILVTVSQVFFAFGVRTLGLAPAIMGCVVLGVACVGSHQPSQGARDWRGADHLRQRAFVYALGLPISLIGPWLGGY